MPQKSETMEIYVHADDGEGKKSMICVRIWQKMTQAHVKAKSPVGAGQVNSLLSEQKCSDGTRPFSW